MFPIADDNDHGHHNHLHDFINYLLIFTCIGVVGWAVFSAGIDGYGAFVDKWSLNPSEYFTPGYLSLSFSERLGMLLATLADIGNLALVKGLVAVFLHGGIAHLAFNMLFLWILGDNLEYVMGHFRYLLFFVLCGILAKIGHLTLVTEATFYKGTIGASGAIAGVMGAYLAYFPRARIIIIVPNLLLMYIFRSVTLSVPAWFFLGSFVVGDLITGIDGYGTDYRNIAVWSHVFGFAAGFILAFPFRNKNREKFDFRRRNIEAYAAKMKKAQARIKEQQQDE